MALTFVVPSKPLLIPSTLTDRCPCLNSSNLVPSRVFRDYLPDVMIVREQLMETARRVYRSYGFSPIDTPALEYAEILVGKGGEESDKQLYRFIDNGDRDIALRFDLTVPFARLRQNTSTRSGLRSSVITSLPSGAARIRSAGGIASSCSAISTRSAPTRTSAISKR